MQDQALSCAGCVERGRQLGSGRGVVALWLQLCLQLATSLPANFSAGSSAASSQSGPCPPAPCVCHTNSPHLTCMPLQGGEYAEGGEEDPELLDVLPTLHEEWLEDSLADSACDDLEEELAEDEEDAPESAEQREVSRSCSGRSGRTAPPSFCGARARALLFSTWQQEARLCWKTVQCPAACSKVSSTKRNRAASDSTPALWRCSSLMRMLRPPFCWRSSMKRWRAWRSSGTS